MQNSQNCDHEFLIAPHSSAQWAVVAAAGLQPGEEVEGWRIVAVHGVADDGCLQVSGVSPALSLEPPRWVAWVHIRVMVATYSSAKEGARELEWQETGR